MQIEKECEPYLNSQEAIKIIKSGNETFKNRIFNCITKYKNFICANILFTHKLIETEIINMCREIAFQDAQIIFLKKVEVDKFEATNETCLPFIKEIFRKRYWGEFQKELKRKMVIMDISKKQTIKSIDEQEDSMNESIKKIVSTFSAQDQKIYNMYYKEGFKLKEIAGHLGLQYQTIREKSVKIFKAISYNWKTLNH